MIERYTLPEMGRVWSDEHKYELWCRVETLVLEAHAAAGRVPADVVEPVRNAPPPTPERVAEIEETTQHDVIAFLTAWADNTEPRSAAAYVHHGMTSSDLLDTALAEIKQGCAGRSLFLEPGRFIVAQAGVIVARLLGAPLQTELGQSVIVENSPGGGTVLGTDAVAKADPDGHTILLGASANLVLSAGLYKNLPYDPKADFRALGIAGAFT